MCATLLPLGYCEKTPKPWTLWVSCWKIFIQLL